MVDKAYVEFYVFGSNFMEVVIVDLIILLLVFAFLLTLLGGVQGVVESALMSRTGVLGIGHKPRFYQGYCRPMWTCALCRLHTGYTIITFS